MTTPNGDIKGESVIEEVSFHRYTRASKVTKKIKPTDSIEASLTVGSFEAPQFGLYTLYFHAFAPFCEALGNLRLYFPSRYLYYDLKKTDLDILPHSNVLESKVLRFKRLSRGDWVSPYTTPGVLFVTQIPFLYELLED